MNHKTSKSAAQPILTITLFIGIICITLPDILATYTQITNPGLSVIYTIMVLIILFIWLLGCHYSVITILSTGDFFLWSRSTKVKLSNLFVQKKASVAILYLTCNDFDKEAFESCILQNYENFSVYVLDDSYSDYYRELIDSSVTQSRDENRIEVIRRSNRIGAKAGNINNAIHQIEEDYVVICDSDQLLPATFVAQIIRDIEPYPEVAYVQGLHEARSSEMSLFSFLLMDGIFLFWQIILPIRERYGFPMFLGHGGIVRTKVIKEIGFPEIVAEDLAFSVSAYEAGYVGRYSRNAISYEAFPKDVREFRKRHMKWVRGTCQFLDIYSHKIIQSLKLSRTQKWDLFISLLQVPIGFFYILFCLLGIVSFVYLATSMTGKLTENCSVPVLLGCWSWQTKAVSYFMVFAPFFPFGVPLLVMGKFLKMISLFFVGMAIYVATLPITFFGMIGFFYDRTADFITTGDKDSDRNLRGLFRNPNHPSMYYMEFLIGLTFIFGGLTSGSLATSGLGMIFFIYPILCRYGLTKWTLPLAILGPFLNFFGSYI